MPDSKSPTQAVEEALNRLSGAVTVFKDERTALAWVRNTATGLMRHKLRMLELSREERDALDPLEAGFIHAADLGTKPRQMRRPWIDALLTTVGEACSCQVVPMQGTVSSWLVGRQTNRQVAQHLLSSLVPTCERLSGEAYYNEYHANRRAGKVEGARGFREKWQSDFVADVATVLKTSRDKLMKEDPKLKEVLHEARQDVVRFMNENFLPTQGNLRGQTLPRKRLATLREEGKAPPSRHRK